MIFSVSALRFSSSEGPLSLRRRSISDTRSLSVAVRSGRLSFSRPGSRLRVTIIVVFRAKFSIIEREMKPIRVLNCSRLSSYRNMLVRKASNRTKAMQLRELGIVNGSMSVHRMTETVVAGL